MGKTNTRGLVIDTDIIIDYLRQSKQSTAFKQLLSENDSQPSIASVTITPISIFFVPDAGDTALFSN